MPKFANLGDRMKFYEQYFGEGLSYLMPYVPAIVRLDGRAFHTFTKGLDRPFDMGLVQLMDHVTKALVAETNACMGYTQSDEITLILFCEDHRTQMYFDGRVSKINSILAVKCSQLFIEGMETYLPQKVGHYPQFDCRCFSVPNKGEAVNAVLWREQDATRNSIQMLGRKYFSHQQLHNKSCDEIQDMLWKEHSVNWNDLDPRLKRGAYFQKETIERSFTAEELEKLPEQHQAHKNPDLKIKRQDVTSVNMPILTRVVNAEEVFFNGQDPE